MRASQIRPGSKISIDVNESYLAAEGKDEKLIFKYIQRMDFDELRAHLNATKDSIDIMKIHDKSGYSPLHYASYKNMYQASKVIIDFLLQDDKTHMSRMRVSRDGETGGDFNSQRGSIYGRSLEERQLRL